MTKDINRTIKCFQHFNFCNSFLSTINKWLLSKGFKTNLMINNKRLDKRFNKIRFESVIRMTGHDNFKLWTRLIGFRNRKHLDKIIRNGAAGTVKS